MTLAFLCSSLEPGRDGVGDYTRRLAEACSSRGHRCAAVALHDRHAQTSLHAVSDGVTTLRLPASLPPATRYAAARRFLDDVDPAWLSWQFVAYGHHPKGLVPASLIHAARGFDRYRQHVMLHELWIGLAAGSPWRDRCVGLLQRHGLRRFLRVVRPRVLHTSNSTYADALGDLGWPAEVLPLFGNVPPAVATPEERATTVAAHLPSLPAGATRPWIALTFGTLHPQWDPAPTARWLASTARRQARPPVLLLVGRTGSDPEPVRRAFVEEGVAVRITGELPEREVSLLLQHADCGIALHPWALIGKSGVAAAMRDHGLPVLVPRDDWTPRPHRRQGPVATETEAPEDLLRLAEAAPERIDRWLRTRRPPAASLGTVADRLLASFESAAVPQVST